MKEEVSFIIDKNKCIKCGQCVRDCSAYALSFDKEGYPSIEIQKCFGCQHCLAICPTGALSIFDKKPEQSHCDKNFPSAEEMENLIKMRRSCRQFKHENVDKEKINKLLDIMNWVPTGCNYRGLHFSVVDDVEKMDVLRQEMMSCLQVLLNEQELKGVIAKRKDAILAGEDVVLRNAPHMLVVSIDENSPCKEIDPIIALSYFELYAQTLNVATLWCGLGFWLIPACAPVVEKLQIPDGYKIAYVMLFGNSKVDYQRSIQPEKYDNTVVE